MDFLRDDIFVFGPRLDVGFSVRSLHYSDVPSRTRTVHRYF